MTNQRDMLVESQQMFVGQTLVSVARRGDYLCYTFSEGGCTEWLIHVPVDEHKLALLTKALELCNQDRNEWIEDGRGKLGDSTVNTWIQKAETALKSPVDWSPIGEPIVWPKWLDAQADGDSRDLGKEE